MKLRIFAAVSVFAVVVSLGAVAGAQDHAQYYVLDAFGGVHAGGGAPLISPGTPYFGFDVAAAIEYIPVAMNPPFVIGDGYLVLDKFGGVHHGGRLASAPPSGGTPYFGFDAARDIVRRDIPPRIASGYLSGFQQFTTASATFTVRAIATVFAPTDGFLHVTGGGVIYCVGTASDDLSAQLSVAVDTPGVADPRVAGRGFALFSDCASVTAGNYAPGKDVTVSTVIPVGPGGHSIYVMARKEAGTGTANFGPTEVTAVFVAADGMGALSRAQTQQAPAALSSPPRSPR